MWCNNCQQDVPGIAALDTASPDGIEVAGGSTETPIEISPSINATGLTANGPMHLVCSQCIEPIAYRELPLPISAETTDHPISDGETSASPPARFESWQWELDQELHDVRRLLAARAPQMRRDSAETASISDSPFQDEGGRRLAEPTCQQPIQVKHHSQGLDRSEPCSDRRTARFAWFVLSLGLMVLVCGGALFTWSIVENRDELWQVGLPVALGGQALMLFGFLLLLDQIWYDGRTARKKSSATDEELGDPPETEAQPGNTENRGPHSFYTHISAGAPPSLLLSDLKGQLDMLAAEFADRAH